MDTVGTLVVVAALSCVLPQAANAQELPLADDRGTGSPADQALPDPTGGAYTSPSLLFTSAAALSALAVRVITGVGLQSPARAVDAVRASRSPRGRGGSAVTRATRRCSTG